MNSTLIMERNKIINYKYNMKNHNNLTITKFVFFILTIIIYSITGLLYIDSKSESKYFFIIDSILFSINIIISSFCLNINIKYIYNFMNKINKDFEYNGTEFYFNIVIMGYGIIFYSFHLFMFIKFTDIFKCRESHNQNNIININNQLTNINNQLSNINNHLTNIDINNQNDNLESTNQIQSSNINQRNQQIKAPEINVPKIDLHVHPIDQIENNVNSSINNRSDKESERNLKKKLCLTCCLNPIKVIFLPCKHRALCEHCYNSNKENLKNCPICKVKITDITTKIYDEYFEK